MELEPLDEYYLRIFLASIVLSDSSLPTFVQQKLQEIGNTFLENPSSAIDDLMEIAENECLQSCYVKASNEIRKLHRSQERNKLALPEDFSGDENPLEINNRTINRDIGKLDIPTDLELVDLLYPLNPIEILVAPDSVAAIQSYIEKVRVNIENVKNNISQEVYESSFIEILSVTPLIYE